MNQFNFCFNRHTFEIDFLEETYCSVHEHWKEEWTNNLHIENSGVGSKLRGRGGGRYTNYQKSSDKLKRKIMITIKAIYIFKSWKSKSVEGGGGQRMTQKKSYLPKKYDSKKKISPAKKY